METLKKSRYPCPYCSKYFGKKINMEKHLLSHPSFTRKFRLRIPARHFVKCDRKASVGEKIKTAPTNTYEKNANIFMDKNASNSPSLTCEICGYKSKTHKGIKIHFRTIHKRNEHMLKSQSRTIVNPDQCIKQKPQDEGSDEVHNHMETLSYSQTLYSCNTVCNVSQNAQRGFIYTSFQMQSVCNSTTITNLPNSQNASSVANQNEQVETVPKFGCRSIPYIKSLKAFLMKCKTHGYPLTPIMCQTVCHLNEEILNALMCPEGDMRTKYYHHYFMKINEAINEIMCGQFNYVKEVVIG